MNKKFLSLLICSAVIALSSCSADGVDLRVFTSGNTGSGELPRDSYFEVHYIDVGQADCELIVCDGEAMLIDGGNAADSSLVVTYLDDMGIDDIAYMLCTHAHEDHVGGLSGPLSNMTVHNVYAPKETSDAKCYKTFEEKAAAQTGKIKHPQTGDKIKLGSAEAVFYAPNEDDDNLNNTSIMCRITYGDTAFLFTGDAEASEEADIMAQGVELSADVLKAGHHGSSSSSSEEFIRVVNPSYTVISCGKDNSYGHPHYETFRTLYYADTVLYRTDMQGHIIAESDGSNIIFATERNAESATNPYVPDETEKESNGGYTAYIGNKNSKRFHRLDCYGLPKEENRVYFSSLDEAVEEGYKPCTLCRPTE